MHKDVELMYLQKMITLYSIGHANLKTCFLQYYLQADPSVLNFVSLIIYFCKLLNNQRNII